MDKNLESAGEIKQLLESYYGDADGTELDESTLNLTFKQLLERYDKQFVVFGTAPKFPTPHHLL